MIHRSFPSGNIDHIVLNIHSVKHSVFDWLDCGALMRLTSELGEEASRNARYSKQLCDCLFSGPWIISVKSWHMLWKSYPFMQQKQPSPTSFLVPPGCLAMARLRVLVSAGRFEPGGADRPVCPPSVLEPLWSQQTKPGSGGMYQRRILL